MIGSGDKGKAVDAVCLDFTKAFDILSHSKPVASLSKYGLNG